MRLHQYRRDPYFVPVSGVRWPFQWKQAVLVVSRWVRMQKPVRAEPTAVGADGEVVRELPGCTGPDGRSSVERWWGTGLCWFVSFPESPTCQGFHTLVLAEVRVSGERDGAWALCVRGFSLQVRLCIILGQREAGQLEKSG